MSRLVPKLLLKELEESGLEWTVEDGSKHFHLRVEGQFLAILPKGRLRESDQRNTLNVRAKLRRMIQEKEEKK